jgi:hypothetical protein
MPRTGFFAETNKIIYMKKLVVFSAALASLMLSGCASSGFLNSTNVTNVELSKGNYKIVATSVTGTAKAGYLFGASFGVGLYTQTMALIPLTPDRMLYKNAVMDLWKNFETKYGSPVGKKLALVNLRYDSESLNVFFYTKPTLTVIADVVEFTE